jgi:hypothetical protein
LPSVDAVRLHPERRPPQAGYRGRHGHGVEMSAEDRIEALLRRQGQSPRCSAPSPPTCWPPTFRDRRAALPKPARQADPHPAPNRFPNASAKSRRQSADPPPILETAMKLHFPWNEIHEALQEVRTATTARPLYGKDTGKGLWLVGDEGVYFMPNTTDGIHHKPRTKGEPLLVVYARECDPTALNFDIWWANKRASFGGDDGVAFFTLADVEKFAACKPKYLVAEFTATQIALSAAG